MAVVGKPAHFVWVGEQDGVVVAAVAAVTQQSFTVHEQQCSGAPVLLARQRAPGIPLLQELAKWIKSRPVIKLAVVELEPGASPALVRAFRRLGFSRQSANLAFVRVRHEQGGEGHWPRREWRGQGRCGRWSKCGQSKLGKAVLVAAAVYFTGGAVLGAINGAAAGTGILSGAASGGVPPGRA